MSVLDGLRVAGESARTQSRSVLATIRRISPGPALVRALAAGAGFMALMVALPSDLVSLDADPLTILRVGGVALVAAVVVGLTPRTRLVTIVAMSAVCAWLVSTIGFLDPVSLVRVAVLTAALYVMHAASALAAVIPYDAIVPPALLVRWLARTAAVLGVGLVIGILGLIMVGLLPSARSIVGPIVGSIVAAGLAGLLGWLFVRRS